MWFRDEAGGKGGEMRLLALCHKDGSLTLPVDNALAAADAQLLYAAPRHGRCVATV
jgi:hypothetical protein